MLTLYFGDLISILTTAFVLALTALIVVSAVKRRKINKWGWLILVFVIFGTAVSGLSATRDAFMMDHAVFAPVSIQSIVCAAAGGLIYLAGFVTIFVRKQNFRRVSFFAISALFLVQVVTVEASRIVIG